jgi:hypothetical protein
MANAVLFDAMTEPRIAGNQLELKVSAIVNREKHLGGMFAALSGVLRRGFDALDGVHAGGSLPLGTGPIARYFRERSPF